MYQCDNNANLEKINEILENFVKSSTITLVILLNIVLISVVIYKVLTRK
jgi:hypothetical protein